MSEPFLSEIRIFAFNFPPKGWAFCNGQTLPIAQNQALFSLLGTTYGGNGQTTFQLPNLQGKVSMGFSNFHNLGEASGSQAVNLTANQIPAHTHTVNCNKSGGDGVSPVGKVSAFDADYPAYSSSGGAALSPVAIGGGGSDQPHNNLAPYLVVSFCIALVGVFPSRN